MINSINPEDLVKEAKLIIFDSDGVLIEEGIPLDYAIEFTKYLKKMNKTIVIFTNNSTVHPLTLKNNYLDNGFQIDDIVTSSMLTVDYCKSKEISKVYVIGEIGLFNLLRENNINTTSDSPQAVIVGMDRTLTYEKLAVATRYIRKGCRFIGTNPDKSYPTPRGLEPGAGSMIAALKASCDKQPEIILGKPEKFGFEYILQKHDISCNQALMIGDRYETDILGAINTHIPAIIVATGVASTRKDPGAYNKSPRVPVIDNFGKLMENL